MNFLADIFNDLIDIATIPVKLVSKVSDDIMESDTLGTVQDIIDSIKIK